MIDVAQRVREYERQWCSNGYRGGIPDESPQVLEKMLLAPSYRQLALALLRNDLRLHTLGFAAPSSDWYWALKRIELAPELPLQVQQKLF
jgi:predicted phosphoadenosine phosphosulfate sulfurtransferase